mmetsp:Transcript_47827/g.144647  ORF Transcript_47827/g.144647 Transcript_47827/m.144647 type:complete len:273 (+) Transcript_47827:830-1648(+)
MEREVPALRLLGSSVRVEVGQGLNELGGGVYVLRRDVQRRALEPILHGCCLRRADGHDRSDALGHPGLGCRQMQRGSTERIGHRRCSLGSRVLHKKAGELRGRIEQSAAMQRRQLLPIRHEQRARSHARLPTPASLLGIIGPHEHLHDPPHGLIQPPPFGRPLRPLGAARVRNAKVERRITVVGVMDDSLGIRFDDAPHGRGWRVAERGDVVEGEHAPIVVGAARVGGSRLQEGEYDPLGRAGGDGDVEGGGPRHVLEEEGVPPPAGASVEE